MVNIWLIYGYYMVNNNLVGGAISPSWKMMEFVNGKDDIPYMKWKIKNVWNHQAVFSCCLGVSVVQIPSKSWRSTMVWCLLLLSQPAVPSDHSDYSNVSSYTVNVDRKLVGFCGVPRGYVGWCQENLTFSRPGVADPTLFVGFTGSSTWHIAPRSSAAIAMAETWWNHDPLLSNYHVSAITTSCFTMFHHCNTE